jgi:glycosyltransferase involved in cell wall biosynthesis
MSFGLPVGREAAEYLRELGAQGVPMCLFPNTPDVATIGAAADRLRLDGAGAAVRRTFGVPDNAPLVLFVGRLIEAKRPHDVLEAFLRVANRGVECCLGFVGDGPLLPELKSRAEGHPAIFFPGWIEDQEQLLSLRAASSLMVLPSEHEPWGAVVNEAMAVGVPVIASDRVGAASELIEHGKNGYVYPVGNVRELSELLYSCLADRDGLTRLSAAARATALAHGDEFAAGNLVSGALAALASSAAGVRDYE